MAAVAVARVVGGPGLGLLPLLAVGPAIAAVVGGLRLTLAAGAAAMAGSAAVAVTVFAEGFPPAGRDAVLAAAGVTAAAALASQARARRDRDLVQARMVAGALQQVVLQPVPDRVGPVSLAVSYQSASPGAGVGGDFYEVAETPSGVRLIVGDAQGKGLPAVQLAAAVVSVFREAAHEDPSLTAIACRIEASLSRRLGDEQFVTAILAEVPAGAGKAELLTCGHPGPLMLGQAPPRLAEVGESLPLGLAALGTRPRVPVTVAFPPGTGILFYTDGATEARNKAGQFFPLDRCDAVHDSPGPAALVTRLADEITRYAGHAPDDDIALLAAYHDPA
jgi:serine phosphatase RsbU (regulator of sigma subunit)